MQLYDSGNERIYTVAMNGMLAATVILFLLNKNLGIVFATVLYSGRGNACYQGPNFQNFPKILSKDLPMSDDLGITKKFSFPNFHRFSLHFQKTSSFLIFLTSFFLSSTNQMRLYRSDVIKTTQDNFFGQLLILVCPQETHFTHHFVF